MLECRWVSDHCVSQPSLLHLRTLSDWESTTIPHRHPFKASSICLGICFCLECLVSSEGLSSTAKLLFVAITASLTRCLKLSPMATQEQCAKHCVSACSAKFRSYSCYHSLSPCCLWQYFLSRLPPASPHFHLPLPQSPHRTQLWTLKYPSGSVRLSFLIPSLDKIRKIWHHA